ncbi:hypothetical protein J2W30_002858 [Variovorax boronicumulans]|uniref:hypothetical protein n=1 Tax=Variovorax boronicumulans TaxID=436515 RepID=UPI0027873F99|nr:hypothetical protein [Variovorax boronicumulans]MDQ0035093.1 hypothetical protein [Variovorax boronicumulans]MDQ0040628.1 hypothetical protein [Variovorax boronicumulans]
MTTQAQPVFGNTGIAATRQEHWLIFINLFVALSAGALASLSAPMMLAVLYIDIWLFANPHLIATYTRIRQISPSIKTHWVLIFIAPILIAAGLTIIALAYEAAGLLALYFVLQAFHVTRQSYGIGRRCDRRLQAPYQRLPYFLIYIFPVWGYLHRSAQAPDSFLGYPIWLPPVPQELASAIGIVAIVGALIWSARLWHCRRAEKENSLFNSFVFSHLLISLVSYILIKDITLGWLVVNVWHNIQYLVFVYRQQQNNIKASNSADELNNAPVPRKSFIKILKRPTAFFSGYLALGAIFYIIADKAGESLIWLGFPTILIAHLILNFHHYLADGFIWKRRR